MKAFLEDVTGKKISEGAVRQAVNNSNQAAAYYHEQLALRKEHDPVTSLTNELYAIFMCHPHGGFAGGSQVHEIASGRCGKGTEERRSAYSLDAYDAIFAGTGKGYFSITVTRFISVPVTLWQTDFRRHIMKIRMSPWQKRW